MMCYRDITFCPFWEDCASAVKCSRPLTEQVKKAADKWWNSNLEEGDEPEGAPICVFSEKPDCHVLKQTENN